MELRRLTSWTCVTVALVALLVGGCTTEEKPEGRSFRNVRPPPKVPAVPLSPENAVNGEASAARLHDVLGVLLMYYSVNRELPPTLDDLKPYASIDTPLDFTSPGSGKPYVYTPQGLRSPGKTKIIILHEADPIKGQRWCILSPDGVLGPTPAMEVLAVPEPYFRIYAVGEAAAP